MKISLLVMIILLSATPSAAQVLYGSLVGTVQDSSGSSVPGALVSIRQTETGLTRVATSGDSGSFTFPTLAGGTYDITVSKPGFQTFSASSIAVVVDQAARLGVTLRVEGSSQSVQVSAQAATMQTDSAEVRREFSTAEINDLPAPANRNFENLLVTVPGFTPPANQNVAQSNPSRGLTFAVNGAGRNTNNIRIDGASANNIWVEVTGYVPGIESIDTVNVVTNGFEAAQGLAGGAVVNVHIKSGTNQLHAVAYGYNTNNAITARPFFAPATQRQPKNINNYMGGTVGGPILKNKLFYFASYDGQFIRQNAGTYTTVPTADIRAGNMSGSTTPIYDPATGNPDGTGRTPFAGNIVPASRISPIALKLEGITPLPNVAGALTSNYYATGDYSVNRNTTDGKFDWRATDKLNISARLGWLHHNIIDPPDFGDNGPGINGREGVGYGDSFSSALSATYVVRPNLIVDSYYSATVISTNNDVPKLDQQLGLNYLGIPGTNGPGRPYGGWPQFTITGYTDIGNGGGNGGPIYYYDRQFQYALNTTWVKGAHTIRFGYEWGQQDANHFEVTTAPGHLTFSNSLTTVNAKGAAGGNQYNSYAAFLLGDASTAEADLVPFDGNRAVLYMPSYRAYVQDQWLATSKLTVTAGLGWNYFPIGHRPTRGLERFNFQTDQVELCGVGNIPSDCGYHASAKLFSPTFGLAWRPTSRLVIRAAYSLNYDPETYAYNRNMTLNYPETLSFSITGANSWTPATTLAKGIPSVTVPNISQGTIPLPNGFAINTLLQNPVRDYYQSWNLTLQEQLFWGFNLQAGYVANRGIDIPQALNLNAASIGGGTASEPFNKLFGDTAAVNLFTPVNHTHYDGLQTTLRRRLTKSSMITFNYSFSKTLGICCDDLSSGAPAIALPQYWNLARSVEPTDRTHNFNIAGMMDSPFGKNQRWLNQGGLLASIAGGWKTNAIFVHYSGSPFSVSGPSTSLNSPGNTQRADQVKATVDILGGTGPGQSWFDPLSFAPVTAVRFGTAGYETLRGPATTNLDLSVFRTFRIREALDLQFRTEAYNLSNTPHFSNPNANVGNLILNPDGTIKSLGGYTVITSTSGIGREGVDQRVFRVGLRLSF
jgi:hypothetical protein